MNKTVISSFFVGFVFAIGLAISGMTQPGKVIGFLDISGNWDPSLLFVMGGAVGLHFFTYRWIRRRPRPVFQETWQVPDKKEITPSLLIGSALFGIGWGIVGYCPGPAITSLATLNLKPAVFVASMIAGMYLFRLVDSKLNLKK